jgi:hypothetical protein
VIQGYDVPEFLIRALHSFPSPLMGEGQGGGEPLMGDNLLGLAKALRKRQTDAENLLWRHLRAKQLEGVKFRRQAPLGNYIVDFISFERKIIIEIDGGHHALQE